MTGSFAAAWYGVGRATLDFDLVFDSTTDQLRSFVEQFLPEREYVSLNAAYVARWVATLDLAREWAQVPEQA